MSQGNNTSVPKFGSFKPKSQPQNNSGHGSGNGPRGSVDVYRDAHRRSSRSSDDVVPSRATHSRTHFVAQAADDQRTRHHMKIDSAEDSGLFIVDRRGDPKNVEFGSIHRSDIPIYHSTGAGRILGLAPGFCIDRDASGDRTVVLRHGRNLEHAQTKRPFLLQPHRDHQRPQLIKPGAKISSFDLDQDFIDLVSWRNGISAPGEQDDGVHHVDYRSIERGHTAFRHDLEQLSEADVPAELNDAEREVQKECAEISRMVKNDPVNVELWLSLVKIQAKIVHLGMDESNFSSKERQSLAELRLTICEQALNYVHADTSGRQQLFLIMQQERGKIWERMRLLTAWKSILKECPHSASLWMRYLDDQQSSGLSFSFEDCKQEHIMCLRQLQTAIATNALHHLELIRAQIHIFLRLTSLLRDTGYEEYANAVWQAVLEYHVFGALDTSPKEAKIESFQDFWESDIPRVGEQNARGWSHFVTNGAGIYKRSQAPNSRSQVTELYEHATIATFATEEARMSELFHLPACADEEGHFEDPFREVMFSDLEEILLCLSDDLPQEILIDAFLNFIQLPPRSCENDDRRNWEHDPYIRNYIPRFKGLLDHPSNILVPSSLATAMSLFTGAFKTLDRQISTYSPATDSRLRFIDRVLESFSLIETVHESLGEYWIAFKIYAFPGEALKCAKRLLKQRPSSLRLYNAFALAQSSIEQFDKAFEVWSAAIKLSSALPQARQDDVIYVWHSLILSQIQRDKHEDALQGLLAIADGIAPEKNYNKQSSSSKLKTRQHLKERVQTMLFRKKYFHTVLYAECAALFVYLSEEFALTPAMEIYNEFTARLQDQENAFAVELLHQAKATLIRIHLEKKMAYKPILLRDCLSKSIQLFPENSIFLDLYCRIGDQTRLDDRLRSALHGPLSGDQSTLGLTGCSAAIVQELYRYRASASGASVESVRSIFARILLSPTSIAAHSSFLWAGWLSFETQQEIEGRGIIEPQRYRDQQNSARKVFLDGVRCLPWCKTWVVTGMRFFGQEGSLQKEELKHLYELMVEREMRLRVPLETSDW